MAETKVYPPNGYVDRENHDKPVDFGVPDFQTTHVITIFESNMEVNLYRGSRTTVVFTDFSTPNPTTQQPNFTKP